MTVHRLQRLTVVAWLVLLAASAATALEVPYLAGRVNDLAGMLSDATEADLEQQLAALEAESGAQVVVLTVPSLEGDPLEDFSLRVAETWRLGREGVDDGVLLLIARDERQVRIEVGYGLEGALPDALSHRIITGLITPRFRAGDFDGGVEAAAGALAAAIRGEELVVPEPRSSSNTGLPALATLLFLGLFFLPFFNAALRTPGAGAWFLYLFLTPFLFVFPAAVAGLAAGIAAAAAWLVLFPILRSFWPKGPSGSGGRGGWGPIWTGGSSGRSSGGFSGGRVLGGRRQLRRRRCVRGLVVARTPAQSKVQSPKSSHPPVPEVEGRNISARGHAAPLALGGAALV